VDLQAGGWVGGPSKNRPIPPGARVAKNRQFPLYLTNGEQKRADPGKGPIFEVFLASFGQSPTVADKGFHMG